jgi:CBS domain-containing protein
MLAQTLINPALPAAKPTDSLAKVLGLMQEHQTHQLSVVGDAELMGLINSDDIRADFVAAKPLSELRLSRPAAGSFVFPTQHAYDVLALMAFTGNHVVPVLEVEGHKYMGSIGRTDMMKYMGDMLALKDPGGIVVVEVARNNYQLREIASIVESNDARVLSLYLSPVPDSTNLYVTIKVNVSELSQIVLGFERYGYKIAYTFFDRKQMDDTRDRYEALLKFINI